MADVQARVDDYLDDQIQTAADLDGINALLARIEEQQSLLQKQVCSLHNLKRMNLHPDSLEKPKLPESKLKGMPMSKPAPFRHEHWTFNASRTTLTTD